MSHPLVLVTLKLSTACAACCTTSQERQNKLEDRQILVFKISPDKVEKAYEIASLEETLEEKKHLSDYLRQAQRQPGKRC